MPVPGDADGDGETNVNDLLAVIGAWGSSDATADFDFDGTIGVEDLLAVIAGWGTCP